MMGLSSVSTLDNSPLNSSRDVANWVQELQRADQTFYNMMTLEIWSLAQTMDELQPGFWADYMQNRQTIVQQYIKERRQDPQLNHPPRHKTAAKRKRSPFGWATEKPVPAAPEKLVASFSEDLERDLPKVAPRSARSRLANPPIGAAKSLDDSLNNVVIIDVFGETEPPLPRTASTAKIPDLTLVKLPHLMRFPVTKILPAFIAPEATGSLATTAIACWLTRNFLVPAPGSASQFETRKRCDRITLEPGESVVCQLGFHLAGLTSAVQVQLAKSLRSHHQLTATWFEAPTSTHGSGELQPSEVMVKLTNRGSEPCVLKAGQAFCRLEFLCPTTSVSNRN
jgi:hypothetical protein